MTRLFTALLACAILSAAEPPPQSQTGADAAARQMKRFIDAWKIMNENTADPVNPDQAFYRGAIPGLLRHLDPHSVFFDPGQYAQLKQMESSNRKGFGSVVSILPG